MPSHSLIRTQQPPQELVEDDYASTDEEEDQEVEETESEEISDEETEDESEDEEAAADRRRALALQLLSQSLAASNGAGNRSDTRLVAAAREVPRNQVATVSRSQSLTLPSTSAQQQVQRPRLQAPASQPPSNTRTNPTRLITQQVSTVTPKKYGAGVKTLTPRRYIDTHSDSEEEQADALNSAYPSPPTSSSSPVNTDIIEIETTEEEVSDEEPPAPVPPAPRPTANKALARASTAPVIGSKPSPAPTKVLNRTQSDNHEAAPSQSPGTLAGMPLQISNGYQIIAHDVRVQSLMDAHDLAWAVQWEIARGVSNGWWRWEDVTPGRLHELHGGSDAAGRVVNVMMGKKLRLSAQKVELWKEYDREQKALIENKKRGLGLMGDYEGQSNWYGGKIQQVVRVVKPDEKDSKEPFHLQLDPPKMGRSFRFARLLGSRRLLQMKIPKTWEAESLDELKKLFNQKFVLCGRVFMTYAVKDRKLNFVEVDENYDRESRESEGDHLRQSLETFVNWYNPMGLNGKQKITKYMARFDLGLSTSVPALEFPAENIEVIDDQNADHPDSNIPVHKVFTDGCGFINNSALIMLSRQLGYTERPTAVQGRCFGAKGVWLAHPTDVAADEPPRIWIRKSQLKIHLVDPANFKKQIKDTDRAHRIFDVVAPSRVFVPARLSKSTVINLEFNGVPKALFAELMEEGLNREIEALTKWDGFGAMPLLWIAVNKACGVATQRLQRTAAGIQRALGLTGRRDLDDDSDEDEPSDNLDIFGGAPGQVDTPPVSIGESVAERLRAGFNPLENRELFTDIKQIVENTITRFVQEFHIGIPLSAEAFIVPDPTGMLEEGQIHFKSTSLLKDPLEHFNPHMILGDVLMYRNPARLPSDVQRVTAVSIPELANYVDVIVVPVKGSQSLPSLLAGGDVDGDTAVCIYDERIVQHFKQPETSKEPKDFEENFEDLKKVPTVGAVLQELNAQPNKQKRLSMLCEYLLTGLQDLKVGLYSKFHENALYRLGYNHPVTIRFAFMFATILDSRKSGHVLKSDVFTKDKKGYGQPQPLCLGGPDDKTLIRPARQVKEPFILDILLDEGKRLQKKLISAYMEREVKVPEDQDKDLLKPWQDISRISSLAEECERVRKHVEACKGAWGALFAGKGPRGGSQYDTMYPGGGGKAKQKESKKELTKRIAELAQRYASGPDDCPILSQLGKLEEAKASCMYGLNPKFAMRVAFQALCSIKAAAHGSRGFTREFSEMMSIAPAAARVLSQDALTWDT